MNEASRIWREETVAVAGTELSFIRAGSGRPLLVLHEELGHSGWLGWHTALAGRRSIHLPLHPGFGRSPAVEWIAGVRDLAAFYARVLRELKLAPVDVIGLSLGGWVAAEMAASCPHQIARMALVAPMGIRPPQGEILDCFLIPAKKYLNESVHDTAGTPEFGALFDGAEVAAQFEAWEDARAQTARLAWSPYMHDPSLAPRLEGVDGVPTLLVWGAEDRIIPPSAGEAYRQAIRGAELVVYPGCGHRPEIERQPQFNQLLAEFFS